MLLEIISFRKDVFAVELESLQLLSSAFISGEARDSSIKEFHFLYFVFRFENHLFLFVELSLILRVELTDLSFDIVEHSHQ